MPQAPSPLALRASRQAMGFSRRQLGAAVGVSWMTVKRWERGDRVPTEGRIQSIEQLLTREGVDLRILEAIDG